MEKTGTCEIPLKNREGISVIIDCHVRDAILADAHLHSIRFIDNLRMHSNGYAIFQRSHNSGNGTEFETIYLHRWIAERFLQIPADAGGKRMFVHFRDGNALNAMLSNLEYLSMNVLRRLRKQVISKTGYRGVTMYRGRFRAVIYHERKAINLGFFDTAEEAAMAYNTKSIELFGPGVFLNKL